MSKLIQPAWIQSKNIIKHIYIYISLTATRVLLNVDFLIVPLQIDTTMFYSNFEYL